MREDEHSKSDSLESGSVEVARLEPGVPGVSGVSGWRSRGYLPHFESSEAVQHVTYHLADSLPKEVVERLDEELKRLPVEKQDVERRKRVEVWMDAGYGCCVLREPVIAEMVQHSFLIFDAQRYRLLAWVVMPNHIHVLFQPLNGWTVARIVASWKSFTGRRISGWMKAGNPPGNARLQPGELDIKDVPRVWHREYWDRFMRDERHFQQTVEYIYQNPVKARLVAKAEDWRWSSAYAGNAGNARLQPGKSEIGT